MTIDTLFPEIREELHALARELRDRWPGFDPRSEPFHLTGLVLVWCVREIVRMREASR